MTSNAKYRLHIPSSGRDWRVLVEGEIPCPGERYVFIQDEDISQGRVDKAVRLGDACYEVCAVVRPVSLRIAVRASPTEDPLAGKDVNLPEVFLKEL